MIRVFIFFCDLLKFKVVILLLFRFEAWGLKRKYKLYIGKWVYKNFFKFKDELIYIYIYRYIYEKLF